MLLPFAAVILAAGPIADAACYGRLVETLSRMRNDARTVEIDFTLERRDAISFQPQTFTGQFVALRTDTGTYAQLRLRGDESGEEETYVLRGDDLTEWRTLTKTVTRYPASQTKGALRFAADNFSGLVWLLDSESAARHLQPRVVKRDKWFAYLDVKTDEAPLLALFGKPRPITGNYRIVVSMTETAKHPKNTIRQVFRVKPSGETESWKVTKWTVDSRDHTKVIPSDFPDPNKPPQGWTVQTLK